MIIEASKTRLKENFQSLESNDNDTFIRTSTIVRLCSIKLQFMGVLPTMKSLVIRKNKDGKGGKKYQPTLREKETRMRRGERETLCAWNDRFVPHSNKKNSK